VEKEAGLRSWAGKEKEGGGKRKKVFKFQNPLETMHQHVCNSKLLYFIN
jgi:hypothetical protein